MISEIAAGVMAGGLWAAQSTLSGRAFPLPPILEHVNKRQRYVVDTVAYGHGQKLDIWRHPAFSSENAPVLVFIPGGGWVMGSRRPQGYALMSRLVEEGWICAAIDYRTAPRHRWPTQLEDAWSAYRWIRENVGQYGGDPDFVAVAGASAGGHLASLIGLGQHWPEKRPDAVVPLYGSFDWEDRSTPWRKIFMAHLECTVVGKRQAKHPLVFWGASPINLVDSDAPPFFIVHGTRDNLIPVGEARRFHRELLRASDSEVRYLEIPGAVHAFDLIHAGHTGLAVDEISDFLFSVWSARIEEDAV